MVNQALVSRIESMLSEGYSEEEVTAALRKEGRDDQEIKNAFDFVHKDEAMSP